MEAVPAALRSLLPEDGSCLVREGTLGRDADALTARVAALDGVPWLQAPSGDVLVGNDLGPDTVRTGVDAMLRHVVPYARRRMKNRDLLARTAVDVLGPPTTGCATSARAARQAVTPDRAWWSSPRPR